jgi:hypothetical protein
MGKVILKIKEMHLRQKNVMKPVRDISSVVLAFLLDMQMANRSPMVCLCLNRLSSAELPVTPGFRRWGLSALAQTHAVESYWAALSVGLSMISGSLPQEVRFISFLNSGK